MRMDILKYVFIRSLKLCNFIFKDKILYLNETTENQIFRWKKWHVPATVSLSAGNKKMRPQAHR